MTTPTTPRAVRSSESEAFRADSAALRVGVIGVGYWGPNIARNLAETPGVNLVAIADLSPDRLAHISKRHQSVHTTTNYRDLFGIGVDAVAIVTPPATHHQIGREFIERGVHCLIEKPLAPTIAEAQDLIALAEEHDVRLMTGHTFEYNPAVRAIRKLIDAGDLGDIFYLDAVRTNLGLFQPNTDAMWDLAPHDVSIANYLLDSQPVRVIAHGGSFAMRSIGINDVVYLHLEYPHGRLANIRVSWLDPNKTRRTTVVGDKKMLVYDDVETLEKLRVYDKGVETIPYTDTYGEFQCSYRYGSVTIPHLPWREPLGIECRHFVESILSGTTPQSDGVSGLRVVEVLEAATRSLKLGRIVDLDEVQHRPATLVPR